MMRKSLYITVYVGGLVLSVALLAIGIAEDEPAPVLLAFLPLLLAGVVTLILIYRMWSAIDDGTTRPTKGLAIGLLFVPVFNLYWQFRAIAGYPQAYNDYLDRHSLDTPRLGGGLFVAVCVLNILGVVPLLGLITAAVNLLLMIALISKVCDAVNALSGPRPPLDPAVRARRRRWTIATVVVLVFIAATVAIGAWISEINRIREFKAEARATIEEHGPTIAVLMDGVDPSTVPQPPRELYDLMSELRQDPRLAYAVLYFPDPADKSVLWRYQGKFPAITSFEEDTPETRGWRGIHAVPVENELERAMQRALDGDPSQLDEFNRDARVSWQSVIPGSGGQPLAVFRLTREGWGGSERELK